MSMLRRGATVLAAATAVTFGLAVPALAHVTINPGTAEQGGFTKVAFRVPNERDDASTVKVEVAFPTDHPLLFVSVKPVPGWTVKVVDGKLPQPVKTDEGTVNDAVTKVVWSGGKINAGEFQEFEVSMGQMPKDTSELTFPTTQTYSGGEVVKWADPPKADGSEAEHPIPTLKLVASTGDDDHHAAAPSTAAAAPTVKQVATASSTSDGTARVLGGAGVVVGAIGVIVALLALRRRPS
ncbi:YcnI family copper-binding membrane protein [Nonomuraea sediminis]|uniref:YcnI family copper-binding membrane protein n=1 Tax=Nonomuraea sediminis TaxID=2835864 RepID=UPI001BDD6A2A|nr:YcnI family protein [Nonomuraea sediminis]